MRSAADSFGSFLSEIEFKAPKLIVFTNTTGKSIKDPERRLKSLRSPSGLIGIVGGLHAKCCTTGYC